MRTIYAPVMRCFVMAGLVSAALAASPSIALAQIGVGARLAWVTANSDADVDRVRFVGGQIRLLSSRWGLEAAMDRHSEEFPQFNQKVIDTPIQTSLLMRMGRGKVTPFLLAGPGWYRRKVQALDGADAAAVASTEFGCHFGVHGDYRYTFLDFNDDNQKDEGIIGRLLPGHRGSMWTLGASVYF
jgi:Outer membrane protein beta-barrel domain